MSTDVDCSQLDWRRRSNTQRCSVSAVSAAAQWQAIVVVKKLKTTNAPSLKLHNNYILRITITTAFVRLFVSGIMQKQLAWFLPNLVER